MTDVDIEMAGMKNSEEKLSGSLTTTGSTSADSVQNTDEGDEKHSLLYGIDENPPWYICSILGFQVRTLGVTSPGSLK